MSDPQPQPQKTLKSYEPTPLRKPREVDSGGGQGEPQRFENPPHKPFESRGTGSKMDSPDDVFGDFPFRPVMGKTAPYTFTLAPSYVHEFSKNLTHSVTKVDQVVVIGDVWWLNIITQPNGDITATKSTTEFEEVTTTNVAIDGDYWIKAFKFIADPDGGTRPAVVSYLHENITWDYRANINVGAGAEVFKGFSLASFNEFRSLDSAIADIGAVDSLPSGDTLTLPVYVTAAVNGDEIELSGKVVVPDSIMPAGTAGQMLYHNGTDWIVLGAPAAPAADTVNLLTHNGTLPAWVNKDIEEIDVCVSGSPTTWDIIKF